MYNIEIFINGRLADIDKGFALRLNRQLINPAELNNKDAQNSYSVTFPATSTNNEIFNFANIEEVKNKFQRVNSAEVIVNGVRTFKGNIKIYEITANWYKGNLYKPVAKEVKDIFADLALPDNPAYYVPFTDFAPSISAANVAAQTSAQPAIYPYVLYGLLPKSSTDKEGNVYSARDLWDSTVRYGMSDFPPSINVLRLIKHLFTSNGYALQGNAFNDASLVNIYQSFKNTQDFKQPWNWGRHGVIKLNGSWSSNRNRKSLFNPIQLERGVYQSSDGAEVYSADLLDALNTSLTVTQDPGKNVLNRQVADNNGKVWTQAQIMVPASGFYKIKFGVSLNVDSVAAYRDTDPVTQVQHVGGTTENQSNDLLNAMYEIKILRDRKTGDFGLGNGRIDGKMVYDNLPQNSVMTVENSPKYYPSTTNNGYLNFIDPFQNKNHVLGFLFGRSSEWMWSDYKNITDVNGTYAQMQAAKSGNSWNLSETTTNKLAIMHFGYKKWGILGSFDNPGDNPNLNLDYSTGAIFINRILDSNGNLGPTTAGYTVLNRFTLQKSYTYVLNGGPTWNGQIYVHLGPASVPYMVVPIVNGVATFSTAALGPNDPIPTVTLYLRAPGFNVNGTLVITRTIDANSANVIGLEDTYKYRMILNGAPQNYARRGEYLGASAPALWNAQGELNAVVWLEAGELLTVASSSYRGRYRRNNMHTVTGWVNHTVNFNLELTPYRQDEEWGKIDVTGKGTAAMNWTDPVTFDTNQINLVKFLPPDMKTNDYIDNVAKALNLKISAISPTVYSLDIKNNSTAQSSQFIDLDGVTSVYDRVNTSLGLPYAYKIGFTVNTDEEGYYVSKDDGGGEYRTGAIDGDILEQKSNFSYNWFKTITKTETSGNVAIQIPVISKHEVWEPTAPYLTSMLKRFPDLALRFWYPNGLLNATGATFNFNGASLSVARVSNALAGGAILNYKNVPNSLMKKYFSLLINSSSHFTSVEAYLSSFQYTQLNGDYLVRINGDAYYVAEITGYDPTGRNKTSLKLIRYE